jgi:DNA-binding XRE family transcriptional regulator
MQLPIWFLVNIFVIRGIGNMIDLKQWRKERKLTQEKAAQALGLSYRHYQRLEAGHSPIRETLEILIGKI